MVKKEIDDSGRRRELSHDGEPRAVGVHEGVHRTLRLVTRNSVL